MGVIVRTSLLRLQEDAENTNIRYVTGGHIHAQNSDEPRSYVADVRVRIGG